MSDKTPVPTGWTTAKLAYFCGLISASQRSGDIVKLVEKINKSCEPGTDIWFRTYASLLQPWLPAGQLNGCVDNVERFIL